MAEQSVSLSELNSNFGQTEQPATDASASFFLVDASGGCNITKGITGPISSYDGRSEAEKAAKWGQQQAGALTALPTYTGTDSRLSEVILIKRDSGAFINRKPLLELGGTCGFVLTDPDNNWVNSPSVAELFANVTLAFVNSTTGIIGAFPTLLWYHPADLEVVEFSGPNVEHSIVGHGEIDHMDPAANPALFIEKVVQIGKRRGFVAAYPDFIAGRDSNGNLIFGVTHLRAGVAESRLVAL